MREQLWWGGDREFREFREFREIREIREIREFREFREFREKTYSAVFKHRIARRF